METPTTTIESDQTPHTPQTPHGGRHVFKSAADILATDDRATLDVPVAEWDTTVRLRALSAEDRERFEAFVNADRTDAEVTPSNRAMFLQMAIVDPETGDPLFTPEQVQALGRRNGAVLTRLFALGRSLSRMSVEDGEALYEELKRFRSSATLSA